MATRQMERSLEARRAAAAVRLSELGEQEERLLEMLQDVRGKRTRTEEELRYCEGGGRVATASRRSVIGEETWRRTARELGTFTTGELAAALDVKPATASRHLNELIEAGILKPAGRAMGRPIYEYVKPTEAGAAFEQQRKLTRVPDPYLGAVDMPVRGMAVEGSGRSGDLYGGIQNSEVRAVVKRAIRMGWDLQRTGTNHFKLVRAGCKAIPVPGTTVHRNAAHNVEAALQRAHRRSAA